MGSIAFFGEFRRSGAPPAQNSAVSLTHRLDPRILMVLWSNWLKEKSPDLIRSGLRVADCRGSSETLYDIT